MNKRSILYKTLARALSIKRPHATAATEYFTMWLCNHLPKKVRHFRDDVGNLHVDARTHTSHRTLFVAHVDTVHRETGPNKFVKEHGKWLAKGAPLGADDGAGCAMLMHLLHSRVPGYYIFTQGEECGGIGARHLAKHHAALLSEFDRAIAFDRRGIDSVITHQGWGRCCSDTFAQSLADQLNADDVLMYLPDSTGVYTDTAEFTELIPECTNISVGYYSEHSEREHLDTVHFELLAHYAARLAWDNLPTDRDPTVPDPAEQDHLYSWKSQFASAWTTKSASSDSTYAKGAYYEDEGWVIADADEDDWEANEAMYVRDALREALYDADSGHPDFLIDLMCEAAYPEDVELCRRHINAKRLTESVIHKAMDELRTYEPATVLLALFDHARID